MSLKPLLIISILAMTTAPAFASSAHMDRSVQNALKEYHLEADIESLTRHQKAMIVNIAYSGAENGRRQRIRAVIEGGLIDSLFN